MFIPMRTGIAGIFKWNNRPTAPFVGDPDVSRAHVRVAAR